MTYADARRHDICTSQTKYKSYGLPVYSEEVWLKLGWPGAYGYDWCLWWSQE